MTSKSKKAEAEPKRAASVCGQSSPKPGTAQAKPSLEQNMEARRRATKSKQLHAWFGGMVGLLMSSCEFRILTLAEIEKLVVPAVTSGQFMIAEAQSKQSGIITPVAAILWATVSEKVDRRQAACPNQTVRLAPKDWNSGDIPWLMIAAGMNALRRCFSGDLRKLYSRAGH